MKRITKLVERCETTNRYMLNIGLYFTVPLLQRYMTAYDIVTDDFKTGIHVFTVRIGSRRTDKWYHKFITVGWVPK